jgi:hypothetical protein
MNLAQTPNLGRVLSSTLRIKASEYYRIIQSVVGYLIVEEKTSQRSIVPSQAAQQPRLV